MQSTPQHSCKGARDMYHISSSDLELLLWQNLSKGLTGEHDHFYLITKETVWSEEIDQLVMLRWCLSYISLTAESDI